MARTVSRRKGAVPADLNATLERLAATLGDRIGAGLARALAGEEEPARQRTRRRKKRCSREGCERAAAAKGLCKSHYNLMLYHRRKRERATGSNAARRRR